MVGVYSPTLSPWLAWTSYGLGWRLKWACIPRAPHTGPSYQTLCSLGLSVCPPPPPSLCIPYRPAPGVGASDVGVHAPGTSHLTRGPRTPTLCSLGLSVCPPPPPGFYPISRPQRWRLMWASMPRAPHTSHGALVPQHSALWVCLYVPPPPPPVYTLSPGPRGGGV